MRKQKASVVVIGPIGEPKAPGNSFRELPSMQLLTAYLITNGIRAKFVWGTEEQILGQISERRHPKLARSFFPQAK